MISKSLTEEFIKGSKAQSKEGKGSRKNKTPPSPRTEGVQTRQILWFYKFKTHLSTTDHQYLT